MPIQGDVISLDSNEKASRSPMGLRRGALLVGASLVVYAALPTAAQAQQECGVPPPEGVVTCTPAGNPYLSGITYPGVTEDLTIVLDPGVQTLDSVVGISTTTGVDLRIEGQDNTFVTSLDDGPTAAVAGISTQGTVFVGVDNVLSTGNLASGVFALGRGGTEVVADLVSTTGDISPGVLAIGYSAGAYTVGPVTVTTNSVVTQGAGSVGVIAVQGGGNYGGSGITINSGTLLTTGENAGGILALAGAGTAYGAAGQILINSGSLSTLGDNSAGITALSAGGSVNISGGAVSTQGNGSAGVVVTVSSVAVPGAGDPTVGIDLDSVSTLGDDSTAVSVTSVGSSVNVSIDEVSTVGENSAGVMVVQGAPAAPPPPPPSPNGPPALGAQQGPESVIGVGPV